MTNRLSIDIVNHYMSEERQEAEIARVKKAAQGTILYSTYTSNHNCIKAFEALLDVSEIRYDKTDGSGDNMIHFTKK